MPDDEDEELTLPQIAELLHLNPSTIRLWVREDRLRARRVGRKWVVRRGDLMRMLAEQPHIGYPKRRGAVREQRRELVSDWSDLPYEVSLDLSRSGEDRVR